MPRPIATINSLIGDASFLARHGRLPTPDDDETERVATHLAFTEAILRRTPVPAAQRSARSELLDVLRAYVAARRFPLGEAVRGRLPAFVDREGTRCAVAALVDHTAGPRASERVDAHYHDAFVADIDDPVLATLAAEAGLTRGDLALIQPGYAAPPPAIVYQADATAEVAVASTPGDHPVVTLGGVGVQWEGHRELIGRPIVAIDGEAGTDSSGRVPYAVEALVGTDTVWYPQHAGILAGVRLDAQGSRVPQAWTIPIDASFYVPWPHDRERRFGAVGGIAMRFAGADRALGWNAGIDFAVRHWHVKVGVDHVGDLTFTGLAFGVSTDSRYDPEYRDW